MNLLIGMSNLVQAQMACGTAKLMCNTRTNMSNDKNVINTEIKLDGHSTAAKDQRLGQIDDQTSKTNDFLSKALRTIQEQTQQMNDQQNSATSDQAPDKSRDAAADDTNEDSTASVNIDKSQSSAQGDLSVSNNSYPDIDNLDSDLSSQNQPVSTNLLNISQHLDVKV